jgi:ATP-dependent helicase HepA
MSQTNVEDLQSDFLILRWWLTERRQQLNYSWEEVAQIAGTTTSEVQRWADGATLPDRKQLFAIARHLRDPNHPPGAEPLPDASPERGDFVMAPNGLGIGKCLDVDDGTAAVEYFDTVAEREQLPIPVGDLRVVRLANQTRCYVSNEGNDRWQMGRVRRLSDGDRIIELPGQEATHVEQENLYVRWAKPVEDPIETLKQKGQETVFFRNHRTPFVRSLLEQRAVSRGATGLLSSNIDFYSHQVEVVRRVLEDPVQRYLLADEVGLGKTIEAGAIIRQFLIDHAGGSVRIFAPSVIRQQWAQEMDEKLDLGALEGTVEISALEEVEQGARQEPPDLLVIDEAHEIAQWAFADDRQSSFERLASWIHNTERVLLLSATPAHRHEDEFLAMLHLLDPATYSLDDREAFRKRIQQREQVGGALRDLQVGEEAAFPLRMAMSTLRDAFPDDEELQEKADRLAAELDADPVDASARDETIRSLRLHVKERYRLHHRMLRSRRSSTQDNLDTQRTGVDRPDWGMDPREEEIHDLLDQWRMAALAASDTSESERTDTRRQYVRLFQSLMEAAGCDLDLLADVVRVRLTEEKAKRLFTDLSQKELETLQDAPAFKEEEPLLRDLLLATEQGEADADDDFVMTKEEWLTSLLDRQTGSESDECWVVFVSYPSVARKIQDHLQGTLGEHQVALHAEESDPEELAANVQRFREDQGCQVLVCDRSAEVGRNLQFADHLLHYDLPWAPNRIEQRMGRLDRIGRQGREMHTHVYLGAEVDTGSIFEAWYHILAEGLGAFQESMADLQFLIDKKEDDLVEQRFADGAENVDAQVEALQEEVEEERAELERQHQFEELEVFEQTGGSFFERLQELEEKSAKIQSDLDGWIVDALKFHPHKRPFPDEMLQYQPNFEGQTLVPFDIIMNRFLPRSDKPVTYHRSVAVNSRADTGTAASMLRVGHPFLDGLRDYFEWDDRGRAYAIWRQSDQWQMLGQDNRLYFRFEFVLQADVSADDIEDVGMRAALQRRADATFPPRFETVVTDRDGTPITNGRLKELVTERPKRVEDGGTDVNVKDDRLPLLDRFIDRLDWPDYCQRSRDRAEEALRASDEVVRRRDDALQRAETDSRDRIERLRLRTVGSGTGRQRDDYEKRIREERRIADVLRRGIETPSVRLDSVGAVILSGKGIPTDDG